MNNISGMVPNVGFVMLDHSPPGHVGACPTADTQTLLIKKVWIQTIEYFGHSGSIAPIFVWHYEWSAVNLCRIGRYYTLIFGRDDDNKTVYERREIRANYWDEP